MKKIEGNEENEAGLPHIMTKIHMGSWMEIDVFDGKRNGDDWLKLCGKDCTKSLHWFGTQVAPRT